MMTKQKKRLLIWRIVIGTLIVCNMAVIFMFSAQSRSQSAALSRKITSAIVRIVSSDSTNKKVDENKNGGNKTDVSDQTSGSEGTTGTSSNKNESNGKELTAEQKALVNKSHTPVRKMAHMLEFGSLATLSLLFLITWPGRLWWRYLASLGFAFIYAGTDELHQLFSDGRGARFSDVMIDFSGACIACTIALVIITIVRQVRKPEFAKLSTKEKLSAFWAWIPQTYSRIRALVSKQTETLENMSIEAKVPEQIEKET